MAITCGSPRIMVWSPSLRTCRSRPPLRPDPHDVIVDGDNRFAFVTNAGARTVSVIDIPRLLRSGVIQTPDAPSFGAWSSKAQMLYVVSQSGAVSVINPTKAKTIATI